MRLVRVDNPPNPYETTYAEWLEPPPLTRMEVYEERADRILSENDSPDLPFTFSVNPYRGCQHACAYCYARPYHEYLGYGAGTDFDTRIIVKVNAAERLRVALQKKKWRGLHINFSGITDCYQPIEASYGITRACLEVCREFRNPVAVVTKSFLVVRDADVLADLHRVAGARVYLSIPFADAKLSKLIEPQAPAPQRRFEAVRRLSEAGIPTGVFVAPIIPGLNDREIPKILEQAAEAGAKWANFTALRLPGSVENVFVQRLKEAVPLRAERVLRRIREIRGGNMTDGRFGARMKGQGTYWEAIKNLFEVSKKRFGLDREDDAFSTACDAAAEITESLPPDSPARKTREKGSLVQLSLDFA